MERLVGLADVEVRLLGHRSLAMVVSDIDGESLEIAQDASDTGQLAALAQRHDAVVRAAMEASDAILPLRLGTVLRDASAGRGYLASEYESLECALRHVAHRREWGIQVTTCRDETATREQASAAPPGLGVGASYLARRRHEMTTIEAQRRRRAQILQGVSEALRANSVDVAPGQRRTTDTALAASYLVERELEAQFLETVDACGDTLASHGASLRATGPWPPYSFVRVLVTEEAHD